MYKSIDNCLCCDSNDLELLLDFGNQPLANSYRAKDQILPEFPLALNLCKTCHHLQLTHLVNPDLMFKNYLYVSGTSKTMLDYFDWFVKFVEELDPAEQLTSVLDIGCNDGSLLDRFRNGCWETYGIDPAENLYIDASKRHNIKCEYFDSSSYTEPFDIIVAQNVFAHNSNPKAFLDACELIMHDDSLLFIQTSQADLVLNNEFDSCYHEHVSFFNINSMNELVKRTGLNLIDVIKTSIHGISYLFILSKIEQNKSRVKMLLDVEKFKGLQSDQLYHNYVKKVKNVIYQFRLQIANYRSMNYKIIGYGAAAKGMTLLGATKINLDFVIDDNPLKQGLYAPVGSMPIVPVSFLESLNLSDKVLFVPLAWNYFDEIKSRIKAVRNNSNDAFIKYFPEVTIVND